MLLLIFSGFTDEIKREIFTGDNLSFLLRGISLHLLQPIKSYTLVGMVVAEILSKHCFSTSDYPLKFEYDDTDETNILKNLVSSENSIPSRIISKTLEDVPQNTESEDSDFEPIETFYDQEKQLTKRPFYVRECFEGLCKTKPEDMEYFTTCLNNVENLVYNCPEASVEEALEFCRQLLHLHIEYEVIGFTENQRKGLIALCSIAPVKVSKYLSEEFFNDKNGRVVRYNILHVLTKTSQKLSGFNDFLLPSQTDELPVQSTTDSPKLVNKAKTRYFFKRPRKPVIESRNFFNEFATHFFYPLLNGVNPASSFQVLEDGYDLLSRFIYTLGIVVHCSVHCFGFTGIVKEYLSFLKTLRKHTEICVRRAVQVCFGITLISLSGANPGCIEDLIESLTDWQLWLMHASDVTFELDAECSSLIEKNHFLLRDLLINGTGLLLT